MKNRLIIIFTFTLISFVSNAQRKIFNGKIKMSISITSKTPGISGEDWMHFCLFDDTMYFDYSGINTKYWSSEQTVYALNNKKISFAKFKGIDTLFDKSNDTPRTYLDKGVNNIDQVDSLIYGYKCLRSTIISDNNKIERVYLDTSIFENGELISMNFIKETPFYIITEKAINVVEQNIDSKEFNLPDLPKRDLNYSSVYEIPSFEGNIKGWNNYLNKNLRANLGSRYIKLPKGEAFARESVFIIMAIDKHGSVIKSAALNEKHVHPKLAKEALRVLNESPLWMPAKFDGREIPFLLAQRVTFQVNAE